MYEKLQEEAAALNIEVEERVLKKRIKGLYGGKVIWINKNIDSSVEKACVLAEELGHFYTSVGDILDQSNISNIKQERRARSWAVHKLIPLERFIEAFKKGCRSRYEIAEFLEVTEEFLEQSLKFYSQKYGNEVQVDDEYVLFFNPLAVYKNIKGGGV